MPLFAVWLTSITGETYSNKLTQQYLNSTLYILLLTRANCWSYNKLSKLLTQSKFEQLPTLRRWYSIKLVNLRQHTLPRSHLLGSRFLTQFNILNTAYPICQVKFTFRLLSLLGSGDVTLLCITWSWFPHLGAEAPFRPFSTSLSFRTMICVVRCSLRTYLRSLSTSSTLHAVPEPVQDGKDFVHLHTACRRRSFIWSYWVNIDVSLKGEKAFSINLPFPPF